MSLDPNLKIQVDPIAGTIDIRQSAISSFMDCRRKFFYEYVLGIEPDYADGPRPWTTADTGTAFHEGIGAYYLGNDPTHAVHDWVSEQWPDEMPEKDQLDLVRIMLDGHIADLAETGDDIGETTIAVEVPVIATVHDVDHYDITIHGRVDRLIETDDGVNIVDDWKSVASFASIDNYIHQLGRYALLVRSGQGWRADRVRTTQVKRVKRTKDGPFYQRPWTPLSEDAYATHATNLRAVLRDLVRTLDNDGPYYEHFTGECSWKCRVQDICQAQMRGDDPETIVELHYREKGNS
jgi:hypothetical protein